MNVTSVLRKYMRVWKVILKNSLSVMFVSKIDFIAKLMRGIMVLGVQIIIIQIQYSHTDNVVGWRIEDYLLLLGIFNTVNYVSWAIFSTNLWRIEEKVSKGEFDFALLKPLGSIFSASFCEVYLDDVISALSGFVLIFYYFIVELGAINLGNLLFGLFIVFFGWMIWFSYELIFASVSLYLPKNGLREFKKRVVGVASFPIDIFSENLRIVFYTILPIAFISSVPVKMINGALSPLFVLYAFIAAFVMLFIARIVWYWGIKRYTSAGG